ncbi:MAG: leucyl aminopeptidase family protein [Nocardioides sp.]
MTSVRSTLPPQVSPPQFAVSALRPDEIGGADAVAFPVLAEAGALVLGPGADQASQAWSVDLLDLLDAVTGGSSAAATAGHVVATAVVTAQGPRPVFFVGVGDATPDHVRRAAAALARAVKDRESVVSTIASVGDEDVLAAFVIGMMLGSFSFDLRADGPGAQPVARVVCAAQPDAAERDGTLARAVAIGGAAWRSRMLATVPANIKNPPWLAEVALELADEAGLQVEVWDETKLAKAGMGGILAVGQASATPPRLIRLDYAPKGASRKTPRVVLVGKGITFDTGGLSIKPGEGMVTMKRDMTGGAVVMATMAALAAVGCPVRVTGLIAAAENAVGGDAMRPGDVITHYGGRTTEVTNTDAEGRLVMADALAFAVDKLDPAALVDVATLTGGIKVALGQTLGGLFADSDPLAEVLLLAGRSSGEPLWRMPLEEAYVDRLASKIADADNSAGAPQSIMAAHFLHAFTGNVPWAHLDLASVGDARKDEYEWTAGPTGFGARVLLTWLGSPDPLDGI